MTWFLCLILWRNKMTFLIFQVWGTKWTNIKLITWLWTLQQPMKSKITIEFRVLDLPTDWSMVDGFRDFVFWPSTDVPCMVRWSTYGYIPPWFPLRFLRISLILRLTYETYLQLVDRSTGRPGGPSKSNRTRHFNQSLVLPTTDQHVNRDPTKNLLDAPSVLAPSFGKIEFLIFWIEGVTLGLSLESGVKSQVRVTDRILGWSWELSFRSWVIHISLV